MRCQYRGTVYPGVEGQCGLDEHHPCGHLMVPVGFTIIDLFNRFFPAPREAQEASRNEGATEKARSAP